jgi:1-acyl-sn-glycerol-3-phosphate acyltransferase
MISFENINKPDWKYELLHHYVNVVHNYVFYHHYYVLHKERLLKDQPLVVICNHQNGLSDALGILCPLEALKVIITLNSKFSTLN